MKTTFLDFEAPLQELEDKIESLKYLHDDSSLDISYEIERLQSKAAELTKSLYSTLTPWQISQVARHPHRPQSLDIFKRLFTNFVELHGDRRIGDDPAIVSGLARFEKETVVIIGQQKGRDTREKVMRNFGMPKPEGYRKAIRLIKMAEKFAFPVLTFIDTSGAYPGKQAEEQNQSEAIGFNLAEMSDTRVPIICTIIGEGGSGGALALGIGDVINMLEYAIYSVISPEGCASILWKSADKAPQAAETLGIIAPKLKELNLIDNIIPEPIGGAHRNYDLTVSNIKCTISASLKNLKQVPIEELVSRRLEKIANFGQFGSV